MGDGKEMESKLKDEFGLSHDQIAFLEEKTVAYDILYAISKLEEDDEATNKGKDAVINPARVAKYIGRTIGYVSPLLKEMANLSLVKEGGDEEEGEREDKKEKLHYVLKNKDIKKIWGQKSFADYYISKSFTRKGGAKTSNFLHRTLIRESVTKEIIERGIDQGSKDIVSDKTVIKYLKLNVIKSKGIGYNISFPTKRDVLGFIIERVGRYVHFISNSENEYGLGKVVFVIVYIGLLKYETRQEYNMYIENMLKELKIIESDVKLDIHLYSINKREVLESDFIKNIVDKIIL